ncbi:MAG: PHP domain-containing protein, partial [Lachnospiraceae bacterium]|nr:PHP domain-containing protein [Lachnospiraceae bacterium]
IPEKYREAAQIPEICRVCLSADKQMFTVYVTCEDLLSFSAKQVLQEELGHKIFPDGGGRVVIEETYPAAGHASPGELFEFYLDYLLEECKEESRVNYTLLASAKRETEGDEVVLTFEENFLSRAFARNFTRHCDEEFGTKFGRRVPIRCEFVKKKEKTEGESEDDEEEIANIRAIRDAAAERPGRSRRSRGKDDLTQIRQKNKKDPDVFYGRNVEGERIEIREITDAIGEVVIRGEVVSEEERETKSGRILVIFTVTDDTDSISCKLFLKPEAAKEVTDHVKPGKFLIIKGVAAMDTYEKEISITSVAGMKECENFRKTRKDEAPVKRVELHAHTCMSDMDALVQEADLVKRAMKWGHPALAITDHGVVQGFTNAFHALQKLKPEKPFKLIYGCEIYLVDDTARMAWNVKGQGFSGSYVVFDLETTGFNAQEDQIIEIGAVKVEGGVITARFSEFVNPEMPIPARITELTSITDEMVHGAKTIRELLPEFFEFIGDSVLVAHNARFDTGFIREKAKQLGLAYDFTVCDTLGMARFLLPHLGRYNLGRLCREFGVDPGHSHRAVDDAEATVGVFLRLLDLCRARDIDSLAQLEEIRTLPDEAVRQLHPSHCIVLAKNDLGRIHLYKIVSEAHLKYFHRVPL